MNYETSENPVSQPIPENGSQIVDTVISNATPVLRRSSRVTKTPNRLVNYLNCLGYMVILFSVVECDEILTLLHNTLLLNSLS